MLHEVNCCEQGKQNICLAIERDHYWMALESDSGKVELLEVKFCPFCGRGLHKEVTQEPTLDSVLASLPPPARVRQLCFDVDGVLADNRVPPHEVDYGRRQPYPWAAPILRRLKELGYEVVCQTARYMGKFDQDQGKARSRGLSELEFWLKVHDIPYDLALLGKASAHLYVDDRGCRVDSNRGLADWSSMFVPALNQ